MSQSAQIRPFSKCFCLHSFGVSFESAILSKLLAMFCYLITLHLTRLGLQSTGKELHFLNSWNYQTGLVWISKLPDLKNEDKAVHFVPRKNKTIFILKCSGANCTLLKLFALFISSSKHQNIHNNLEIT